MNYEIVCNICGSTDCQHLNNNEYYKHQRFNKQHSNRKLCENDKCFIRAGYGYPELYKQYCSRHKKSGMVRLYSDILYMRTSNTDNIIYENPSSKLSSEKSIKTRNSKYLPPRKSLHRKLERSKTRIQSKNNYHDDSSSNSKYSPSNEKIQDFDKVDSDPPSDFILESKNSVQYPTKTTTSSLLLQELKDLKNRKITNSSYPPISYPPISYPPISYPNISYPNKSYHRKS